MFALNHVRTLAKAGVGAGVALLVVMIACATANAPSRKAANPTLSGVKVESGTDGTQISLEGIAHPVFNVTKQDHPAQVVVSLPDVTSTNVPANTPVQDGTVERVSVSPTHGAHGQLGTKVVVSLTAPAAYEAVPRGDGLMIRIHHDGNTADAMGGSPTMTAETVPTDPWASPAPASGDATSSAASPAKAADAVPAAPADASDDSTAQPAAA
jgi:hypothetical protein